MEVGASPYRQPFFCRDSPRAFQVPSCLLCRHPVNIWEKKRILEYSVNEKKVLEKERAGFIFFFFARSSEGDQRAKRFSATWLYCQITAFGDQFDLLWFIDRFVPGPIYVSVSSQTEVSKGITRGLSAYVLLSKTQGNAELGSRMRPASVKTLQFPAAFAPYMGYPTQLSFDPLVMVSTCHTLGDVLMRPSGQSSDVNFFFFRTAVCMY